MTVAPVINNNVVVPGSYQLAHAVPIGSIVSLSASGGGSGYDITRNQWANGTVYSNYTAGDPGSPALVPQTLEKNVDAGASTYKFIIDATPRHYSIVNHVTYANGAHGDVTLSFDSVSPDGTIYVVQPGTIKAYRSQGGSGNDFTIGVIPGIKFQETVTTGQYTGGKFMFMQIVNQTYSSYTDVGGPHYVKNDIQWPTPGPNPDPMRNFAGPLHDDVILAYGFNYSGGIAGIQNSFDVPANSVSPNRVISSPPKPGEGNPETLDVPLFTDNETDTKMTETDKFSMYLMYRSDTAAVWIALAEGDWSWSETATPDVNGILSGPNGARVDATISYPSGDAAFPTWVNTSTNFLDRYPNVANSNDPLNPWRDGDPGAAP